MEMSIDSFAKSPDAYVLSGFNSRLFERMRGIHRTWLEQLRDINRIEIEFGARLLAAGDPAEATSICHEWMAKRLEAVACEQQTFTAGWWDLVSDTLTAPDRLNGANAPEHATHSRYRKAAS
jgi:hypothetical protein